MGLKRTSPKRAEGVGYYSSLTSSADDVLDYVCAEAVGRLSEDPSYNFYDDPIFRVTIIVEEM